MKEKTKTLLKQVEIEAIPLAEGVAFGGLGRVTGAHWIPALPLLIDLFSNVDYKTKEGILGLIKYGDTKFDYLKWKKN